MLAIDLTHVDLFVLSFPGSLSILVNIWGGGGGGPEPGHAWNLIFERTRPVSLWYNVLPLGNLKVYENLAPPPPLPLQKRACYLVMSLITGLNEKKTKKGSCRMQRFGQVPRIASYLRIN